MAFSLAPFIKQRFFDTNGDPLAGGLLYTYQSGTTTPQATYTDSTGGTPNANPVVLDANGEANVWTDVALSYKYVLKNSSGATQWTVDNVIGLISNNAIATASIQDSAVTTAKIADDAVTAAKLADDASVDANRAVTTNHIRDAAVTNNKLDLTTTTSSDEIRNLGLAGSVGSNALTIALKTKAGTDASTTDYINIGFRDSTSATGTYTVRKVSAALSIVIPSTTTIGTVSGAAEYIYVYAIDNAGTVELGVSLSGTLDTGSIITTVAVSGGTSRTTLYSTAARTGVPFRMIGRILITEATAGTWATSPATISPVPFRIMPQKNEIWLITDNGYGSSSTKIRRFTTTQRSYGTAISYADSATLGAVFNINEEGIYTVTASQTFNAAASMGITLNSNQLTTAIDLVTVTDIIAGMTTGGASYAGTVSATLNLVAGDAVRLHTGGTASSGAWNNHFRITKHN